MTAHRAIALGIPQCLGCIFAYAAAYKLLWPGEATLGLVTIGLEIQWATAAVFFLVALEFYIAVLLLLRIDLRYTLAASTLLLLGFTAYLWYLSTLSNPPACGCMGLTGFFGSNRQAAFIGVVRNCLLLFAIRMAYDCYFPQMPENGTLEEGATAFVRSK